MKKTLYSVALVLISSFVIVACSKDNEEDQNTGGSGGGNNCVTTNMKYAADIQPILQTNCYGCHDNGQSGGVNLGNYNGVKTVADNGRLLGAITHASGYHPMPRGSAKLPNCTIEKIRSWINAGALNN